MFINIFHSSLLLSSLSIYWLSLIGKRLHIGVGFGHKNLVWTWSNVWAMFRMLCVLDWLMGMLHKFVCIQMRNSRWRSKRSSLFEVWTCYIGQNHGTMKCFFLSLHFLHLQLYSICFPSHKHFHSYNPPPILFLKTQTIIWSFFFSGN